MSEYWKDIKGYEGLYQISNYGNVKSFYRNIILSPKTDKDGYKEVSLTKDHKKKTFKVHRLVAVAFLENPDNLPQVNHKDECKDNNTVDNLEWCTEIYNRHYGTGLMRMGRTHRKSVMCVETGIIYKSTKEAASITGINVSSIRNTARGLHKTAGGYRWKYYV